MAETNACSACRHIDPAECSNIRDLYDMMLKQCAARPRFELQSDDDENGTVDQLEVCMVLCI